MKLSQKIHFALILIPLSTQMNTTNRDQHGGVSYQPQQSQSHGGGAMWTPTVIAGGGNNNYYQPRSCSATKQAAASPAEDSDDFTQPSYTRQRTRRGDSMYPHRKRARPHSEADETASDDNIDAINAVWPAAPKLAPVRNSLSENTLTHKIPCWI